MKRHQTRDADLVEDPTTNSPQDKQAGVGLRVGASESLERRVRGKCWSGSFWPHRTSCMKHRPSESRNDACQAWQPWPGNQRVLLLSQLSPTPANKLITRRLSSTAYAAREPWICGTESGSHKTILQDHWVHKSAHSSLRTLTKSYGVPLYRVVWSSPTSDHLHIDPQPHGCHLDPPQRHYRTASVVHTDLFPSGDVSRLKDETCE